jgi:predicted nucleic acid-binding protein
MTASELDKSIKRFARSLQSRFAFVEISESLVRAAMSLAKKYGLRGYDSVQLAAALQVHQRRAVLNLSPLIFVSADNGLNVAAVSENLTVENPNNYP